MTENPGRWEPDIGKTAEDGLGAVLPNAGESALSSDGVAPVITAGCMGGMTGAGSFGSAGIGQTGSCRGICCEADVN